MGPTDAQLSYLDRLGRETGRGDHLALIGGPRGWGHSKTQQKIRDGRVSRDDVSALIDEIKAEQAAALAAPSLSTDEQAVLASIMALSPERRALVLEAVQS